MSFWIGLYVLIGKRFKPFFLAAPKGSVHKNF